MSKRHRMQAPRALPDQEIRAKAHSERSRVNLELQQLAKQANGGVGPDDLVEPGVEWKPPHHHDPETARKIVTKQRRPKRHWKTKFWKRRSLDRQAKASMIRSEQPVEVPGFEPADEPASPATE